MVIFFEWYWTAVDQKRSRGLPMTGEDTGLGALASPLVGYLGKVQERAASLECCPWCSSKGLTYALRSYRINLQESVTLCTNPQCLFPLVSQSLEDVLASLDPVEPTVGSKRKHAMALEKEEFITPVHKRLRSSELDSFDPQSITDTLISHVEHGAVNPVCNGRYATPKTDDGRVNGNREPEDDVLDKGPETAACTNGFASPSCAGPAGPLQCSSEALLTVDAGEHLPCLHRSAPGTSEAEDDFGQEKSPPEVLNRCCSLNSNQSFFTSEAIYSTAINTPSPPHNEHTARTEQKLLSADIFACKDVGGIMSETEGLSSAANTHLEELVSVPKRLFWRNSDNLCWLDSLLVALVVCKSLRKYKPKDEPHRSSVWQLMKEYEDVCAAMQVLQQTGRDGVVRVPTHVLQKANADLQSVRMSVFKLLQPKLQCQLGQRETPVFAMPLLLKMDSWAEPLFQSTFHWEFKCSKCKTATKERVMKTLPTFTKVLPDWCPLDAVHLAPCNVCCQKNQRRTMMLESVPPVFALHFVEGLPDSDVNIYTFTFKQRRYSVTTVIQYNQQLKHFSTWICNSDGFWQEYDDLKHPHCKTHQKLPVPATEMHVVFWEGEEDKEPHACSPSSTFAGSPPCKNVMDTSLGDKDEALARTPDQSLLRCHNDTDIVCALLASEDGGSVMDTTVTAVDASIGSTTLLDAFQGLSHDDIITLTLVELKVDSEMQPLNDKEQTEDVSAPTGKEMLDPTPDSSSALTGGEMSHGPDAELVPSTSSESVDGSSSDPAYVPGDRRGRGRGRGRGRRVGRGRAVGRQKVKKAASPKAASPKAASTKAVPTKAVPTKAVPTKAVPTKATPHISPPASTEPSEEVCSELETTSAPLDDTPPVENTQQASSVSSTRTSPPSTSPTSTTVPTESARWSFLLSRHPHNQVPRSFAELAPTHTATSVPRVKPTAPAHSTPNPVRRPQTPGGFLPRPQLRTEESEGLPLKAAEMYGGFTGKGSTTQSPHPSPALLNSISKPLQHITRDLQKSQMYTTVVSGTPPPMPGATRLQTKLPPGLSDTEALRYKLIKKLKAKKKKLAKLNEMLGHSQGTSLRPDSTDLGSPNTVTSSTYDGSTCDDFLSDLLSPATTASNLSPDSTGFLEMLANGQEGVDRLDCGAVAALPQMSAPNTENFLEEFLSQAVAQRPTEMETEALSALALFH